VTLVAAATAQGKSRNPEDGLSLSALREKDASADFSINSGCRGQPLPPAAQAIRVQRESGAVRNLEAITIANNKG
jgi:hypothetical protein